MGRIKGDNPSFRWATNQKELSHSWRLQVWGGAEKASELAAMDGMPAFKINSLDLLKPRVKCNSIKILPVFCNW